MLAVLYEECQNVSHVASSTKAWQARKLSGTFPFLYNLSAPAEKVERAFTMALNTVAVVASFSFGPLSSSQIRGFWPGHFGRGGLRRRRWPVGYLYAEEEEATYLIETLITPNPKDGRSRKRDIFIPASLVTY